MLNLDSAKSSHSRFPAALTVDLEDYRYQQLRDYSSEHQKMNPEEVANQTYQILKLFENIGAKATFFTVGETAVVLPQSLLSLIAKNHSVGCHGYEHQHVSKKGEQWFRNDIAHAKSILESLFKVSVKSYRAPMFSIDGCDPWFGKALSDAGYSFDSSQRFNIFSGWDSKTVLGSDGRVKEVPLASIGFGLKRLTIIGGTYLRIMPLFVIKFLMKMARKRGFLPVIYIHPYDIDAMAPKLDFPASGHFMHRLGDIIRRINRKTVAKKLEHLSHIYSFNSIENIYAEKNNNPSIS